MVWPTRSARDSSRSSKNVLDGILSRCYGCWKLEIYLVRPIEIIEHDKKEVDPRDALEGLPLNHECGYPVPGHVDDIF